MSTASATRPRGIKLPRNVGRFPLGTIVAGVVDRRSRSCCRSSTTPAARSSRTRRPRSIYVVMALGLNIVVGFAGLLDLGYVAFFAIGAYTMGWFGSSFFSTADIHIGVAEFLQTQPGIHLNWLLILPIAALLHRVRRARCSASRRCACAATTSRS